MTDSTRARQESQGSPETAVPDSVDARLERVEQAARQLSETIGQLIEQETEASHSHRLVDRLPDPDTKPDAFYRAGLHAIEKAFGSDFMLAFDAAVGSRMVAHEEKVLGKRGRTSTDTPGGEKPPLVTKLLDLLPGELEHVESLVDSLSLVSDTGCDECGRSVARAEIARHLVVCQGPYGDPMPDLEHPAYGEALDRLMEALEAAGLTSGSQSRSTTQPPTVCSTCSTPRGRACSPRSGG